MDVRAERRIPKVIFLDAANSPKLTDLGSGAQYLDANMSPYLDRGVLVVGELRRCGIWVPFDILRDQLDVDLSTSLSGWSRVDDTVILTWVETKMRRGPASAKKPCWFTETTTAST